MNDNIKRLIEALRSGKYKQGRGYLSKSVDSKIFHCCLGVACEVYNENNEDKLNKIQLEQTSNSSIFSYDLETGALPNIVKKWLGFNSSVGYLKSMINNHSTLTNLNDSGCSFEAIAYILEKDLVETV